MVIVGRPNVGKSTLFNKMCRQRRAIVADMPGITRDRIYSRVEWNGREYDVVDTGGLVPKEKDAILRFILQQAKQALEKANLILFVVNGRDGTTALDEEIAVFLRNYSSKVVVVVNQLDPPMRTEWAAPFYTFGMSEVIPLSAEHNAGLSDLLDRIGYRIFEKELVKEIKEEGDDSVDPAPAGAEEIRIAIVGRPNVGKSTLLNCLIGEERVIVSPIPGTTRDSVDSLLVRNKSHYRFIDTAGIRRKGKTSGQIESMSVIMAQKSLDRANLALLIIDGEEGVTKLDAEIGGTAVEAGCSILILINKSDLFQAGQKEKIVMEMSRKIKFLEYAPKLFISAKTGYQVSKVYRHLNMAAEARRIRISTANLNNHFLPQIREVLMQSGRMNVLPANFFTQVGIDPPTFLLFHKTGKLHFSMERFIENQLRRQYGFYATPLRLVVRQKKR